MNIGRANFRSICSYGQLFVNEGNVNGFKHTCYVIIISNQIITAQRSSVPEADCKWLYVQVSSLLPDLV